MSLFDAALQRHDVGDATGAETRFRAMLAINPLSDGAWNNLAGVLAEQDKLNAAEVCARKAVLLAPQAAGYWSTLGAILCRAQQYAEALEALNRALILSPEFVDAYRNRALVYYEMGRVEQSAADYDRAQIIAGEKVDPAMLADMIFPLFATGDWRRGMVLNEHRWAKIPRSMVWELGPPEWDGTDLSGKTLLVHPEQGYGDTLQWLRCIGDLKERTGAARIVVAVQRELERLLRVSGYDTAIIPAFPPFDCHMSIMSAAFRLGYGREEMESRWPADGYLSAPKDDDVTLVGDAYKVGVVWAARQENVCGRRRSLQLEALLPLAMLPGVKLYSLQMGERAKDIQRAGCEALISDVTWRVRDWADTAAIIDQLDCVVTVDSAPMHLAAILRKPTICLLPYAPSWKWIPRSETSWLYPSLRLIHQSWPGLWAPQVERAVEIIKEWMMAI